MRDLTRRTWCSSVKRENLNDPTFSCFHKNVNNITHSYHLNSNAQIHIPQILRILNSRFALEHRYANQSIIPWSHDQPLAGRDMVKSPFHDELLKSGCVFIESHGFERPGFFVDEKRDVGVKPYDYMGAYEESQAHDSYPYEEMIERVCNYHIHEDFIEEHQACREACAVFDTSAFGKLHVKGPRARDAMEWLCSNNVADPHGTCRR